MSLRTGQQYNARLSKEQAARVEGLAYLWGCSTQDVIRRLLDEVVNPRLDRLVMIAVCEKCDGTGWVPDPKREYPGDPCVCSQLPEIEPHNQRFVYLDQSDRENPKFIEPDQVGEPG